MSARIWVLRREAKRFRRICGAASKYDVDSDAFWATGRRLSDACDERDRLARLARLGRRSRYANRRLDVWLAE